jgi:hypothetical protein
MSFVTYLLVSGGYEFCNISPWSLVSMEQSLLLLHFESTRSEYLEACSTPHSS